MTPLYDIVYIMEWLEKQVAAAFCGSLKQPKRLKYSWNSNDIDFFEKSEQWQYITSFRRWCNKS